jgi:hypothetical protein
MIASNNDFREDINHTYQSIQRVFRYVGNSYPNRICGWSKSAGSTFFRQRPTDLERHAENIVLVVGTQNKGMR